MSDISEDRGFKALFVAYPLATIEVFAPDLITERGVPVSVVPLQQESARPDLADPARFTDLALLATWANGTQAVVVLIEHWSSTSKIDLPRVLWYAADLGLRHPHAVVYPIIFITDATAQVTLGSLEHRVGGVVRLALHAHVMRLGPADAVRLAGLHTRVAAVLQILALRDVRAAVELVIAALTASSRAPGPPRDVDRFLPFMQKLARMSMVEEQQFRSRLAEERSMGNILTEWREQAEAEGRQAGLTAGLEAGMEAGKAEATVVIIRDLVQRGLLTINGARDEVLRLVTQGLLTPEQGEESLRRIG